MSRSSREPRRRRRHRPQDAGLRGHPSRLWCWTARMTNEALSHVEAGRAKGKVAVRLDW